MLGPSSAKGSCGVYSLDFFVFRSSFLLGLLPRGFRLRPKVLAGFAPKGFCLWSKVRAGFTHDRSRLRPKVPAGCSPCSRVFVFGQGFLLSLLLRAFVQRFLQGKV